MRRVRRGGGIRGLGGLRMRGEKGGENKERAREGWKMHSPGGEKGKKERRVKGKIKLE